MSSRNPYGETADNPYERSPYELPTDDPHGRSPSRRRPTALIVILAVISMCLLVCVGAVIYAVTQIGPGFKRNLSHVTATEVASQIGDGRPVGPGEYVLTAQDLTSGINRQIANDQNVDGVQVAIQPDGVEITADLGSQTVSYRADVVAANGEIRLTDVKADAGFLGNVVPGDWIAGGVEDGINDYFRANDLRVASVTLEADQMRIVTEPKERPDVGRA